MKIIHLIALALFLFSSPNAAGAKSSSPDQINVVVTIPDIADIVNRIGGDLVKVTSLTKGRENLHAVRTRPSQLIALSKAQMFIQIGMSLETAFVPGLVMRARNRKILAGQPGFVNLSDGWKAMNVPVSLSRKGGDLHPQGNPHMNLAPAGGRHMATKVLEGLIRNAPESKAIFEKRYAEYLEELSIAEARWAKIGAGFKGQKVVVYHREYVYLAARYGIEILDSVELRPGIPATPNHMAGLVAHMKEEHVKLILISPWSHNRDAKRASELSGARLLELPNLVGGTPESQTWISMMDLIHNLLAEAFGTQH